MALILTKKSDTSSSVPLAADLTNAAGGAELAVNTADKRLYSKTSGGSVVELGTNPSALSLPNGTANGVPYLNGSKVLTSGSALQFDGSNLGLGVTPSAWGSDQKGDAQFGSWLSAGSDTGFGGQISRNGYYNSGWKRINNGTAQLQYFNSDGSISWNLAASGTAGDAISFTQSLALGKGTTLALEGATTQTGTGITFPATQNASSNANTLDDYEEGTWSPVITSNGVQPSVTIINTQAHYTKIGSVVHCTLGISFNVSVAGTGSLFVSLPIVSANLATYYQHSVVGYSNTVSVEVTAGIAVTWNSTTALLYTDVLGNASTATLTGTRNFALNFSYLAN